MQGQVLPNMPPLMWTCRWSSLRSLQPTALLLAIRVANEVKAFKSFAGYLHAVEQVGTVARQNEPWFTHTQDKAKANANAKA